MANKKMTPEEKLEWERLYDYVKREIMHYDDNQKLSQYMILRLKGMKDGKFMANKAIESLANYSYDIILLTFKYVKPRIQYKLDANDFEDDQHRFNFVAKIVGENLNLVYNKVKKINEEKKKLEQIKVDDLPNYENKYVSANIKNVDKNLESFW